MAMMKKEKHFSQKTHDKCTYKLKSTRIKKWSKKYESKKNIKNNNVFPVSDALDSYGAFLELYEVKPFGELQDSFVIKIHARNLVPQY